MTFADQEKWIDKTIQQKERALRDNAFAGHTRDLLEGDVKALQAIKITLNRHRAMRDAVVTVQRMPQTAQHLREPQP